MFASQFLALHADLLRARVVPFSARSGSRRRAVGPGGAAGDPLPPIASGYQSILLNVLEETLRAATTWSDGAAQLLDPRNMAFVKLWEDLPHGRTRMRRPRIAVWLTMTAQGNLVLEWRPIKTPFPDGPEGQQELFATVSDYVLFTTGRETFTGPPSNRVLMIRGIDRVIGHCEEMGLWGTRVLRCVDTLVDDVVTQMGHTADIAIASDWYFTREVIDARRLSDTRITAVHFDDPLFVHQARVADDRAEFLFNHFPPDGPLSPEAFLAIIAAHRHRYKTAAAALEDQGMVREWEDVRALTWYLYAYFPEVYDGACPPPPAQAAAAMRTRVATPGAFGLRRKVALGARRPDMEIDRGFA